MDPAALMFGAKPEHYVNDEMTSIFSDEKIYDKTPIKTSDS